MNQKQGIHQAN